MGPRTVLSCPTYGLAERLERKPEEKWGTGWCILIEYIGLLKVAKICSESVHIETSEEVVDRPKLGKNPSLPGPDVKDSG
jgi:hypothetical protein